MFYKNNKSTVQPAGINMYVINYKIPSKIADQIQIVTLVTVCVEVQTLFLLKVGLTSGGRKTMGDGAQKLLSINNFHNNF